MTTITFCTYSATLRYLSFNHDEREDVKIGSLFYELEVSRIWTLLASEGNFKLIDRLHKAEAREPGYLTVVVPEDGFSPDDEVHNLVIDWLKAHKHINVLNTRKEIYELEQSRSWLRGVL